MKHFLRKALGLFVIYLVIIFGILILQFTKGKTFSLRIGTMTVSGRHEIGLDGKQIPLLPVHIVSNGLDVYMSENESPLAVTVSEENLSLEVLEYINTLETFTILCSEDVSFSFFSETRGDTDIFTIKASFPETIREVFLPWTLTRSAHFEQQDNIALIRFGEKSFLFSVAVNAPSHKRTGDSEPNYLRFSVEQTQIAYKTYVKPKGLDYTYIAEHPLSAQDAYVKAAESFASAALSNFQTALRARSYSEAVVAAYISEMARRGMYRAALENAPENILSREQKTHLTTSFYGSIQEKHRLLIAQDRSRRDSIAKAVAEKKPQVFENFGLIPYLVNQGDTLIIDDLQAMLENLNFANLSPASAAGLLELYMDFSQYFPEKPNGFEKVRETCERKISDALFLLEEGLFCATTANTVDSIPTLDIAHILMRYAKTQEPFWQAIGRMLYSSLFAFAGDSAYLPATLNISFDGKIPIGLVIDPDVVLDAADLYPHAMSQNLFYPHAQSLNPTEQHGAWAWAASPAISIQTTENVSEIQAQFPIGETHYVILCGIQPFSKIEIHKLDFRTDPRFERYDSSGYVYDESTKTLYLKLQHRVLTEIIHLYH